MIEIGRLGPDKWDEYKKIRLEALETDPQAFGSAFEEEEKLTEEEWRRRIQGVLFAFFDGQIVGIASVVFQNRVKIGHIANIYGVYVKPAFRRKGVGKKLLEAALEEVMRNKKIDKVKLTVNPLQTEAVRLYEDMGFTAVGTMKKEIKIGDVYYDEVLMEKLIDH